MREALELLASGDTLERSRALDEAWVVGTTIASCTMGVHAHSPRRLLFPPPRQMLIG